MKRAAYWSLLLLAACGGEPETSREARQAENARQQPPMPELEPPAPTPRDRRESGDAAATLKLYYARIGAGDYDSAWAMRSGEADDGARRRFADNFRAYERYEADVGTPGEPVEANGWAYVEVPVMIRGRYRGGRTFSSAGSVTVRRRTSGAEGGSGWHIYTGER
jgi:hypothetical protein